LGGKRRFYGMGYIDSEVIINDLSQIKEHYAIQNEPVHHALIFPLQEVPTKGTSYKK
jgi:hypothetical protein